MPVGSPIVVPSRRPWGRLLRILVLLAAGLAAWYAFSVSRLLLAYQAKILCSGVFVSHRAPADVIATDLTLDHHRWLAGFPVGVDPVRGRAHAGWRWPLLRVAVHRPGSGCTLVDAAAEPRPQAPANPSRGSLPPSAPDDGALSEDSRGTLSASLLASAFAEPPDGPSMRTRAIVIIHRGRIVAERYAAGFGPDTPLAGWSMAKTALNALLGVLVRQHVLSVDDRAPVPEWSRPGDPRGNITIAQLLRMTSGLRFRETYSSPLEDVMQMLFGRADGAAFAASQPLEATPGSRWQYASGTTNILSRILRARLGDAAYRDAPRRLLFDAVGMRTATLEPDAAGSFVASSFMYASARDWARLGMLFLNDGVWQGRRLLPEGWVAYSRTPTPQSPDGEFGAHLWLRVPRYYQDPEGPAALPDVTFHAIGHEGQFVSVVPSHELVVVRLGLTRQAHGWRHDRFLASVINAVEERERQ
ncbi:serine hydrolase domain-containing protein [Methylolobus aquaticus]